MRGGCGVAPEGRDPGGFTARAREVSTETKSDHLPSPGWIGSRGSTSNFIGDSGSASDPISNNELHPRGKHPKLFPFYRLCTPLDLFLVPPFLPFLGGHTPNHHPPFRSPWPY